MPMRIQYNEPHCEKAYFGDFEPGTCKTKTHLLSYKKLGRIMTLYMLQVLILYFAFLSANKKGAAQTKQMG